MSLVFYYKGRLEKISMQRTQLFSEFFFATKRTQLNVRWVKKKCSWMQNNFLESTSFSGEAPVRMSWNLAQKRFIKCDLSQENVPYDIRSNGWMHGKRTDKKRLHKPFQTDRFNGWTDANFFRPVKSNGWTDVIFYWTVKSNGWMDVNFFQMAGSNGWTDANFFRTVERIFYFLNG